MSKALLIIGMESIISNITSRVNKRAIILLRIFIILIDVNILKIFSLLFSLLFFHGLFVSFFAYVTQVVLNLQCVLNGKATTVA
jgi:hypothetical protein